MIAHHIRGLTQTLINNTKISSTIVTNTDNNITFQSSKKTDISINKVKYSKIIVLKENNQFKYYKLNRKSQKKNCIKSINVIKKSKDILAQDYKDKSIKNYIQGKISFQKRIQKLKNMHSKD